jgi:L-serine dehydratase
LATHIALTPVERGWQHRRYSILREVLGPDFHGPSSSHTAAPQLIALEAHGMLGGVPDFAKVKLFNSFAKTGEGHRTNIAIVAGLLGFKTTDPRTPNAIDIAKQNGLGVAFEKLVDLKEHVNAVELELQRGPISVHMKGISTGGGNFEIVDKNRGYALVAWRRPQ